MAVRGTSRSRANLAEVVTGSRPSDGSAVRGYLGLAVREHVEAVPLIPLSYDDGPGGHLHRDQVPRELFGDVFGKGAKIGIARASKSIPDRATAPASAEGGNEDRRRGGPDRQADHLKGLAHAEDTRQHLVPHRALQQRPGGASNTLRVAPQSARSATATGNPPAAAIALSEAPQTTSATTIGVASRWRPASPTAMPAPTRPPTPNEAASTPVPEVPTARISIARSA